MGNNLQSIGEREFYAEANSAQTAEERHSAHERLVEYHLSQYICRLCGDYAQSAVITVCGHLFCWECLKPICYGKSRNCPWCRQRLLLHEDLFAVHAEGPKPLTRNVNVCSRLATVPRPSGIYLGRAPAPCWFMIMPYEEDGSYFTGRDRSICQLMMSLRSDLRKFNIVIVGMQVILILSIFLVMLYALKLLF